MIKKNKIGLKDLFKLKNILSFLEGNVKYYYNAIVGLPLHTKEQIIYRISICKDSCFNDKGCEYCGCNTIKKMFTASSCNEGNKFPDLMDKIEWEKFKKTEEYEKNI
jgi:hypothetical protein